MNLEVTDNNLLFVFTRQDSPDDTDLPCYAFTVLIHTAVLQTSQPNCGIMIPQPYEEFMEEENVNKNNQL